MDGPQPRGDVGGSSVTKVPSVALPVVGVVGLGQMGRRMAATLVRRGFKTVGFDVDPAAVENARTDGVMHAPSPGDVLHRSQVVLLSLPDEHVAESLFMDPAGLIHGTLEGKVIVDTTTTTMTMAERLAAAVSSKGGFYLDAPVTGGVSGAEKGSLTIMVGGDVVAVAGARPVLEAIGERLVHVGPSGHGQVAKMVNQMLMAAIYTSVAEAIAFATQLGADPSRIYEAVEHGGAESRLLTAIKKSLLNGTVSTNGNLHQHGKDIDYVMEESIRRQLHLPITGAVHSFFQLSRSLGFRRARCHEMWAVWEKLLSIRSKKSDGSSSRSAQTMG